MTIFKKKKKNLRRKSGLRFDGVSDVFLGVKTDWRVELFVYHLQNRVRLISQCSNGTFQSQCSKADK